MNLTQVEQFLLLLGADNIQRDESRGWVRCSCPLAQWRHSGGTDNNPSFGIKAPDSEDEAPFYHCFGCGDSGPLPRLVSALSRFTGNRMAEVSAYLSRFRLFPEEAESNNGKRRIRVADRFASSHFVDRQVKTNPLVPEDCLAEYPLLAKPCDLREHETALLWLCRERRIAVHSIAKYKLRLFVEPHTGDVGVIFPILSRDGEEVLDLWVRMVGEKRNFRLGRNLTGSSVDYKAPNLWFGNHLMATDKPLVLVEGGLDALRLDSLGLSNVAASFGEPSDEQIQAVYAPVVYLGYDNDARGAQITAKLAKRLQVPSLSILNWGEVGLKDAGELENEAQFRIVYDARTKILQSSKTRRQVKGQRPASLAKPGKDGSFL